MQLSLAEIPKHFTGKKRRINAVVSAEIISYMNQFNYKKFRLAYTEE